MVTQTYSPFETLARVIEHLDDDGRSVRRTEAAGAGNGGSLRATVEVAFALSSEGADGLEPAGAAVDDGLAVTFRAPAFPDPDGALPAECPRVAAEPTDVWLDADAVVVRFAVTIGDADAVDDRDATAEAAADPQPEAGEDTDGAPAPADVSGDRDGAVAGESGTEAAPGEAGTQPADGAGRSPRLAAVRDESVPPYDDTPYLRRLYETAETFAEMSDRIDMDVSAETVRRYMTEAGVHSPTSYETAGTEASSDGSETDADAGSDPAADAEPSADTGRTEGQAEPGEPDESAVDGDPEPAASLPDEQLVADGIGLPEELTLRDLVDAVVDARTVHEVQREIDLGHDRTRQLLAQLNVLDLVMGRVSGDADRTVTVDVVADRIRQRAPDTA